jgi:Glycosyl transferase family 2
VLSAITAVQPATEAAPLEASLTRPLPDPLEIGGGTVLYLEGVCSRAAEPGSLRLSVGAASSAVDAERMPAIGDSEPAGRWWASIEIPPELAETEVEVTLRARREDREVAAPLGTLRLVSADPALSPPPPSVVVADAAPLIAVCMATHEPDPERLARQLDSIRAQRWEDWVCVVSDDASSPGALAALSELTAGDPRFLISRSESRLGFYRNFERALRMAPIEASFVALADQDDVWFPDKLAALHGCLEADPAAQLAYSDMRILDESGEVISDTYWILRSNRSDDLTSLLVANTVTGAASLIRRELLGTALPFPPPVGEPYHDHWLAVCALAAGGLAYLDRPTYDRVRHLDSVTADTGHARALREMRAGGPAPGTPPARRERVRDLASIYRGGYLQAAHFARIVAMRLGDRIDRRRQRELERFMAADSSPAAPLWLAARSLRTLIGRDETLGRERALAAAILWRRRAARRGRQTAADGDQSS